jgi:hypothetical protein
MSGRLSSKKGRTEGEEQFHSKATKATKREEFLQKLTKQTKGYLTLSQTEAEKPFLTFCKISFVFVSFAALL